MRFSPTLFATLLVASHAVARAQAAADTAHAAPAESAKVSGRILQENQTAVAGAQVTLVGTSDTVLSARDGSFSLRAVPAGAYVLSVRRLGFRAERVALTLARGETRTFEAKLTRFVALLPTVTTTAEERAAYRDVGFARRMQQGVGQFLTYEQIKRRQATEFSQLLVGLREFHIWTNPRQHGTLVEGSRGPGSCVTYIVDGMPEQQTMDREIGGRVSMGPSSPDDFLDAENVGAIEVYGESERPAEFPRSLAERPMRSPGDPPPVVDLSGQECVLVVVWTRTRLGLRDPSSNGAIHHARPTDVTHAAAALPTDNACRTLVPQDTTDLIVYADVQGTPPPGVTASAWNAYRASVLAALDRSASLPSELTLPVFGPSTAKFDASSAGAANHRSDGDVTPALSTAIAFTLTASGALAGVQVTASSLSGAADTSLLATIERTAAAHRFPPRPPGQWTSDSLRLTLVVASAAPMPETQAAVLGEIEVPRWRLSANAEPSPGADDTRAPQHVTVAMAIDHDGHPITQTIHALPGTNAPSVAVPQARLQKLVADRHFTPARIGSCAVPEFVTALVDPARP